MAREVSLLTQSQKDAEPRATIHTSLEALTGKAKLTNREAVDELRARLSDHGNGGLLGHVMKHVADHLSAAANSGVVHMDDPAEMTASIKLFGLDHCTGCPGDNGSGAGCCWYTYNGTGSCEDC